MSWVYDCLIRVPADDVNYKSALEQANLGQLRRALKVLKTQPFGKTRLIAVSRELLRRQRIKENW
jgi:hypothetical protein